LKTEAGQECSSLNLEIKTGQNRLR
jgi:hypothetical protein